MKLVRSAYESWFSPSNDKTEGMYANVVVVRSFRDDAPHMVYACEQVVEAVAARIAGGQTV